MLNYSYTGAVGPYLALQESMGLKVLEGKFEIY